MKTLPMLITLPILLIACTPKSPAPETTTMPVPAPGTDPSQVEEMVVTESDDESPSKPRTIMLHSSNWEFSPSTITVQQGEDVSLHLMGIEGNHGLAIPDLGINQTMNQGESAVVKIPTDKPGTYPFFCFVPCGPGHADMEGVIVIEPRS